MAVCDRYLLKNRQGQLPQERVGRSHSHCSANIKQVIRDRYYQVPSLVTTNSRLCQETLTLAGGRVFSGCYNTLPQTCGLKQHKFSILQFHSSEVNIKVSAANSFLKVPRENRSHPLSFAPSSTLGSLRLHWPT